MASDAKPHQLELVVDGIVEGILSRVDTIFNYWHVGERPAFTRKLTDEEVASRLMNDEVRMEILQKIQSTEGPEAVAKWLDDAQSAYDRSVRKAAGG